MSKISNYIEKVKAKPEAEKKRLVFMWTVIIVGLIFLVWAITFSLSVANDQADLAQLQAEAEASAQTQVESSATLSVSKSEAWSVRFGQFISRGASSINEGFWTVGSWLH